MSVFLAGDRAYCLSPQSSGGALAHGALYFVSRVEVTRDGEQFLFMLGSDDGWNASRFRRVDAQDRLWPLPGTFDKWEDKE